MINNNSVATVPDAVNNRVHRLVVMDSPLDHEQRQQQRKLAEEIAAAQEQQQQQQQQQHLGLTAI